MRPSLSDARAKMLVRFDPTTGQVERTVSLQGRPASMVLAGRHLWVSEPDENQVVELNAATLRDVRSVAVPSGPTNLAVLEGRLWATSQDRLSVTPIALRTGAVGTGVEVLSGAVDVAGGFGALWVTGRADGLTRITPPVSLGAAPVQRVIVVGKQPTGVATGSGSVWVANSQSGTVSQVDPTTFTVARTLVAGANPQSIAVANGGPVYVSLGSAEALSVLSLRRPRRSTSPPTPGPPVGGVRRLGRRRQPGPGGLHLPVGRAVGCATGLFAQVADRLLLDQLDQRAEGRLGVHEGHRRAPRSRPRRLVDHPAARVLDRPEGGRAIVDPIADVVQPFALGREELGHG